jgi:transposase
MTPDDYLAMLKQMRWRDVHLLSGSRAGSSVQERLLRTQAKIVAIEAALAEGKPEKRWTTDPDGYPLELEEDAISLVSARS